MMVVPHADTIILFMLSALALNLSPGPSIFYIRSRCMGQGRRAGVVSVFGLATATLIHAVAAALGLSTLFLYSPLAFSIVKYCGAAYLVYLGLHGFISIKALKAVAPDVRRPLLSSWSIYRQGVVTDLLNPKVALFFVSFLPQFVDPGLGSPTQQVLLFGLLFHLTGVPVNLLVALAGGSLAGVIARRPVWAQVQNYFSSTVLIALGLKLALSNRR